MKTPYINLTGNSFQNYLINGAMDFWQRGTSTSSNDVYLADRWKVYLAGGTGSVSRQSGPGGIVPEDIQYFMKIAMTAGSPVDMVQMRQRVEDVRVLANKRVTISAYVRTDKALEVDLNIIQVFGSGGSANQLTIAPAITTGTNTWERLSWTVDIPSISGKTVGANSYLEINWALPANDIYEVDITGLMLNVGSEALDFRRAGLVKPQELFLCQRYYEKSYDIDSVPGSIALEGLCRRHMMDTFLIGAGDVRYKTIKRATPTVTLYSPANGAVGVFARYDSAGLFISNHPSLVFNVGDSGFQCNSNSHGVSGQQNLFHWAADAEL